MNTFLKILHKHQAEIDRMLSERDEGTPIPYSVMRDNGMLKPFAVRLPITLVAILDEMVKHGLWESKQEMAYDMIQSAYVDFVESLPEEDKLKFNEIQKNAWEAWRVKNEDKIDNLAMATIFKSSQPLPVKRKRARK
jgi:hypothetical protein